jgi:hypothetical protein
LASFDQRICRGTKVGISRKRLSVPCEIPSVRHFNAFNSSFHENDFASIDRVIAARIVHFQWVCRACTVAVQTALRDGPVSTVEAQEALELESRFALARVATASVAPGASAGFQRRQIANELAGELEAFVATHSESSWTPGVRVWLARNAQARAAYGAAIEHYGQAWLAARGLTNVAALRLAHEAGGALAKLLVLTGRLAEYDGIEAEARRSGFGVAGGEWHWAREMRSWAQQRPVDAFKCGLYCLDQLGRLTQPGEFVQQDITETPSSTNGFTAAELVQIAGRVNLRVYAAMLSNPTNLPVPAIVHLSSGHFVVVREKRGDFYDVYDTVAFGPRWLTAEEIAREASGCVILSEAARPAGAFQVTRLGASEAEAFRGWCHGPLPYDHDDSPCVPDESGCDECTPGSNGPGNRGGAGSGGSGGGGPGNNPSSGVDCDACFNVHGMPAYFVSEPWLNLWVRDTPLHYDNAYGPDVSLRLAFNFRCPNDQFVRLI